MLSRHLDTQVTLNSQNFDYLQCLFTKLGYLYEKNFENNINVENENFCQINYPLTNLKYLNQNFLTTN